MLIVRLSDAEAAEVGRRARAVGVTVSRYVVAAVLERPETINERRQWAAEVARAERVIREAAVLATELARQDGESRVDTTEALHTLEHAARSVVAMGRAAGSDR
jgi:hypothetical protein